MLKINIEQQTIHNQKYRKIISTNSYQQLVLMSLRKGETIPWEKHEASQFLRVERGRGILQVKEAGRVKKVLLRDGVAVIVPPRTPHFIKATALLKLYLLYSPPQHS